MISHLKAFLIDALKTWALLIAAGIMAFILWGVLILAGVSFDAALVVAVIFAALLAINGEVLVARRWRTKRK